MSDPLIKNNDRDINGGENTLIQQRRQQANISDDRPVSALALSGGGIRSATFCLGLVRALAANKVLRRFDFLSTVSGGGYFGGMLGRLYNEDQQAEAVEEGLAEKRSFLLWWLRNNGRYLAPAGFRDVSQAMAYTLRGLLASHFEAATVILFLAALMFFPGLLLTGFSPASDAAPAWLGLMLIPLACALWQICAWWIIRPAGGKGDSTAKGRYQDYYSTISVPLVTLALLLAWHFSPHMVYRDKSIWLGPIVLLFSCLPLAAKLVQDFCALNITTLSVPEQRLIRTKKLAVALLAALACLFFYGASEFCYWIKVRANFLIFLTALALLPPAISLLRHWVKPPTKNPAKKKPVAGIINQIGYLFLLALFLTWATVLLILLTELYIPEKSSGYPALLMDAFFLALMAVYFWLTRRRVDVLNLSSMHNLYRARLERAYISVGNYFRPNRPETADARFPLTLLSAYERNRVGENQKWRITDVQPGDDVLLRDYHPHRYGGPLHLINCCINQTVDDRTGNFNADRKGIALTLSPLGIETGTHLPLATDWQEEHLSKWLAISGAALGTGMGSNTRTGTAALLFTSAIRLGYWNENLFARKHQRIATTAEKQDRPKREIKPEKFPHLRALLGEMLAFFPGMNSSLWYVSDGGHFDNTGVYALLKRRVPLIVLADCGADPDYGYEDIENLVRKAHIDYATRIEFLDSDAVEPTMSALFTTPDLLNKRENPAPFMLARIVYPDQEDYAALIVVKPHLIENLGLDTERYADRQPAFPQQPTSDQFFDENQWEACHELGLKMGERLSGEILDKTLGWVNTAHGDIGR
ncbi:patatin-like phospholipase family protein [Pantoea coffeiphila]|uniref:patatin-like phospholipase family protein n=1 Tax=Pantoea coffeiphila TaxID=1465635 RepID=UPI00196121C1|nr:patatin-like phospholipase family protein [Pantoea coffeiphila]MBM7345483.1 hypothetical protein [Pantoea coffeiphila]